MEMRGIFTRKGFYEDTCSSSLNRNWSQAERLQKRFATLPFKVQHQEEHALLVALIGCTNSQEKTVREVLQELVILRYTSRCLYRNRRVLGEFHESSGDRRLIQAATVLLPTV